MTVFELIGHSAWNDWASRSQPTRIGLFTTHDKAEAKVKELKLDKEWKMSWTGFGINEVHVE